MIHFYAFVLAFAVGVVLAYPDVVAIGQSTISTAAISYIFLPFAVAPAVILVLLVYYFAIFARRKLSKGERRLGFVYGALSLAALLYSGFHITKEYAEPYMHSRKIAQIIASISQMNHAGIDSLIEQYSTIPGSDQRVFILNAMLERSDLNEKQLDKIAKIEDRAIHNKLYSRYGLLGQNRKGLSVARLVALHKNVSSYTLSYLAEINEPYLQGSVAGNSKTPLASLEELYKKSKSNSDGYLIQWGLARNKNTPTTILRELSLSTDRYTKLYAEETLKSIR